MQPAHPGNGLSDLGRQLVSELNRLGGELNVYMTFIGVLTARTVMVDLAHTSDATMKEVLLNNVHDLTKKELTYQVIAMSKAPVVWTHAGARAIRDHARNVPDDILELIGDGPGKNGGIM